MTKVTILAVVISILSGIISADDTFEMEMAKTMRSQLISEPTRGERR